ncbi:MAG: LD-carboxypeptidase [Treponema sp.]|nr:LD-carboxypeptidase [Treponema sp.]
MKIPKYIKPGDTIGVVAPSFGATTEPYIYRFQEAIKKFKDRGYNVVIGECCYKSDGLGISTLPEIAAAELMKFYLDDKIDVVLSCGGGELMCETISHLDFKKLESATPKWFMGYSDNTNFIFPLATMCDVASIYGPNAPGFGKPWEQPEYDAIELLEGKKNTVIGYKEFQNPEVESKDPLSPYIYTDPKVLVSYVSNDRTGKLIKATSNDKIEFSGVLIGGCLDVLVCLSGTKFDNIKKFNEKYKDVIWFLESCDYNPMDIRRGLWHLRESGWFDNAKGFLIGRPYSAFRQEIMGVNQYNGVIDILKEFNVPIILDCDIGHIDPAMPLIVGSYATVLVKDNNIEISMK